MRFTDAVKLYAVIAVVLTVSGQVPMSDAGLINQFITVNGSQVSTGDPVAVNESYDEPEGPLGRFEQTLKQGAAEFGGVAYAGIQSIGNLLSAAAWPLTVWHGTNAPWQVRVISSLLFVAMAMGALRTLRSSA